MKQKRKKNTQVFSGMTPDEAADHALKNLFSGKTQGDKLMAHALKKIMGPGVQERIKRDAARPHKFPGNDGIYYDPNWQDDFIREQRQAGRAPAHFFRLRRPRAALTLGFHWQPHLLMMCPRECFALTRHSPLIPRLWGG